MLLAATGGVAGCSTDRVETSGPGRPHWTRLRRSVCGPLTLRKDADYTELQDSGLTEVGASVDALGGRVGDVATAETAFVHREAWAIVQYTTIDSGSARRTGARADRAVRGLRASMTPYWGEHAYVNYADASIDDPAQAYFGANAARLAAVRKTYDLDEFVTQPQGW